MNLLKLLLCFLCVPCFIILAAVVVILGIRYFYITLPICAMLFWVWIAKGLYDDWF
ncbi:hypothetical protein LCGC14_0404400 [marine sediment metagenome]|uniref:Uncharacterized protein n=1 Tax=marine sediment metagenome TaxID=412755 RepID=A0A0F9VHZ6_9ZZZZ